MAKRHHHRDELHSGRVAKGGEGMHRVGKRAHMVGAVGNEQTGMIHDDIHAPCMLPQHVIEKYWPASEHSPLGMVDNLFTGVSKQMKEDYNDLRREMYPKKY